MLEPASSLLIVSANAHIAAPPERVYRIIADYRYAHPLILPRQFSNFSVLQGGIGAGTRVSFGMKAFGRHQYFEADITEPEPGRTLAEHYRGAQPGVTSFIVDPVASGGSIGAHVTIRTEMRLPGGWLGTVQRFLIGRFLQSLCRAELTKLAVLSQDETSELRTAHV